MYSNELHYIKQKYRKVLLEAAETSTGLFMILNLLERLIERWYQLVEEQSREIENENMKMELT
jgi:hypothetical protein